VSIRTMDLPLILRVTADWVGTAFLGASSDASRRAFHSSGPARNDDEPDAECGTVQPALPAISAPPGGSTTPR